MVLHCPTLFQTTFSTKRLESSKNNSEPLVEQWKITQNLVKIVLSSIWQLLAEHFIKGCVLVSKSENFFLLLMVTTNKLACFVRSKILLHSLVIAGKVINICSGLIWQILN
jgi:hypothetical protein